MLFLLFVFIAGELMLIEFSFLFAFGQPDSVELVAIK